MKIVSLEHKKKAGPQLRESAFSYFFFVFPPHFFAGTAGFGTALGATFFAIVINY